MKEVRHIAICNERFLARFGVDRILVLLAEHLADCGYEITFFCLRADVEKLRPISDRVNILAAPTQADLLCFDSMVCSELTPKLRSISYDAVIIGGWPFFQTAVVASSLGLRSVFIDAGAVPHDGFPEEALTIQREVRRLREITLPDIALVMPISRFVEESQTLPDRGRRENVCMVHLGADHLSRSQASSLQKDETALLANLDSLTSAGTSFLISLGRMEHFGYKNSHVAYTVLRAVIARQSNVKLIILTGPDHFDVPEDVRAHVLVLSTISDAALQAIMQRCTVGISLSLWEGFNLPVAEMQWLGRPALAFNVGAHPEIIADPWFLCQSAAEMSSKAIEIIVDGVPAEIATLGGLQTFRDRFTWDRTLALWTDLIVGPRQPLKLSDARLIVVVDTSNSARDPANSGVIRVTRRLSAELSQRADLLVLFAKWNPEAGEYLFLSGADFEFLKSNSGPADWIGQSLERFQTHQSVSQMLLALTTCSASKPVFLFPEVILDGTAKDRVRWANSNGCTPAFIFYDMLPMYAADFVSREVAAAFPSYLAALGASKAIFAISQFSLSEYERWQRDRGLAPTADREVVWLPAQFGDRPRVRGVRTVGCDPIELLCVSTIEPRKNHTVLIDAFKRLLRKVSRPVRLNLVGNSYAGEQGLSEWIRSVCAQEPSIVWHGIVRDDSLEQLYGRARFTIYPSLTEGFGLPIVESFWMGCPCICHSGGVMSELAAAGGCTTVDMTSADALANGMERLIMNDEIHDELSRQACERELNDWHDYGEGIAARLVSLEHR